MSCGRYRDGVVVAVVVDSWALKIDSPCFQALSHGLPYHCVALQSADDRNLSLVVLWQAHTMLMARQSIVKMVNGHYQVNLRQIQKNSEA